MHKRLFLSCFTVVILAHFIFCMGSCSSKSSNSNGGDTGTGTSTTTGVGSRIRVYVNVPGSLSSHNGPAPVAFGVPFARGGFAVDDTAALCFDNGDVIPAAITITATWSIDNAWVKWLLVESLINVTSGEVPEIHLEFDRGGTPMLSPLVFGCASATVASTLPGDFEIRDGANELYAASVGENVCVLERDNEVFSVYRIEGDYTHSNGSALGSYCTRYRVYKNAPLAKIHHTMEWTGDGTQKLSSLSYVADGTGSPTALKAGLDNAAISSATSVEVRQTAHDTATGTHTGTRLDGWIAVESAAGNIFAAVRWPWQQHPVKMSLSTTRQAIELFSPENASGLSAYEVAATDTLKNFTSSIWDIPNSIGPYGSLSPRGISKTWELMLWNGSESTSYYLRNELLQNPVLAYADPEYVCGVGLPSPMAVKDAENMAEVEDALDAVFDWIAEYRAFESDYSVWDFGDSQWDWKTGEWGSPTYRYWMSNGRGWTLIPWMLWMRSGERKYVEFAEANARHAMDLDMCHVPEWDNTADGKLRGAMGCYGPLHTAWVRCKVADKCGDSEYMAYAFYLTGYERAWDCAELRAEALARHDHQEHLDEAPLDFRGDKSRNTYRVFGELAIAYEATHKPGLKTWAEKYLDLIIQMQDNSGWVPGIKSNFYLEQPLNIGMRVFPEWRNEILSYMKAWNDYLGDVERPSASGNIEGPMSLWTLSTLYDNTADAHLADAAWKTTRAQAMGVHLADNDWRGICGMYGNILPWTMRDWLVGLRLVEDGHASGEEWLPVSHIHGWMPLSSNDSASGWITRHLFFVKEDTDGARTISVHFGLQGGGNEPRKIKIRVYNPSGTMISDIDTWVQKDLDNTPGTFVREVDIASDGLTGAYAVEILAESVIPVNVRTGGMDLVHAYNGDYLIGSSIVSAGALYARGIDGVRKVSTDYQGHEYVPRIVGFYPDNGQVLGLSTVWGNMGLGELFTNSCLVEQPSMNSVFLGFLTQDFSTSRKFELDNFEPYVSLDSEGWFDPEDYVTYDPDVLLNP